MACTNGASIIITHMEYYHYRGTKYRRFRALNVPKYEHFSRTTQYNLLCPRMFPVFLIWRYSILNKQRISGFHVRYQVLSIVAPFCQFVGTKQLERFLRTRARSVLAEQNKDKIHCKSAAPVSKQSFSLPKS